MNLAKLYIFLVSTLSALATPVISNNINENNITDIDKAIVESHAIDVLLQDVVNNNSNDLNKRAEACPCSVIIEGICVIKATKNRCLWTKQGFNCYTGESNWACQNTCTCYNTCAWGGFQH